MTIRRISNPLLPSSMVSTNLFRTTFDAPMMAVVTVMSAPVARPSAKATVLSYEVCSVTVTSLGLMMLLLLLWLRLLSLFRLIRLLV